MLNLDTHILIYLLTGDLSDRERELISQEPLAISDNVLWELAKLIQLGRISINLKSPEFLTCLQQLTIIPISLEVAIASTQLDFKSDPADELIAATSIITGVPLLTRDSRIRNSQLVPFA